MFDIFNRYTSLNAIGVLQGATDWHSHLLPGVDDGIQELKNTLRALEEYEKAGVAEIWLTPHVMEDMPNTPEELQEVYQKVLEAYHGSIKLHLAAENMLDSLFQKRFKADTYLTIGGKTHILVETSYFTPPYDLYGLLESIKKKGLFPILAHPERYSYMTMDDYHKLKKMDVLFQLNIFSLVGGYDKMAQMKARKLLRLGYYNLIGTDTHRPEQFMRNINAKRLRKSDVKYLPENKL